MSEAPAMTAKKTSKRSRKPKKSKPPKTPTPHDALFKAAFQNPEHAAAEFRALLPAELVRRIDWNTLQLESGSFFDRGLLASENDLAYSVELVGAGGVRALLFALLEHQSTAETFMPLRMLGYLVRRWERYRRDHADQRHLPVVLTVVLHHSESGWTEATRLSELLDPSPEEIPELAGHLPEMRLWIDDISHLDDAQLRARALPPFPR